MGTTELTSQAVGAGDHGEIAALLTRVIFAGFLAGGGILIFQGVLFTQLFCFLPLLLR